MRFKHGLAVSLAVSFVGGCATTNCDPSSKDNVIGAAVASISGCYDNRIKEGEERLDQTKQERQEAEQQQEGLKAEEEKQRKQKEQLQAQVNLITGEIQDLTTDIGQIQKRKVATQTEKDKLFKRLHQVKADIANLKKQQASTKALEEEAGKLEQEVADMWEIINSL